MPNPAQRKCRESAAPNPDRSGHERATTTYSSRSYTVHVVLPSDMATVSVLIVSLPRNPRAVPSGRFAHRLNTTNLRLQCAKMRGSRGASVLRSRPFGVWEVTELGLVMISQRCP